jgi:VanZ family protein
MPNSASERESFFWSDRILLLSVAGILFLTLFPFHFALHGKASEGLFPFFRGQLQEGKSPGLFDVLLNVLLFVPFGFGVAEKLRENGKSRGATVLIAWAAGALFSYTVEVLQIYIPSRDSGWGDVITNSAGTVLGYVAYEFYGGWALRALRRTEHLADRFLRPRTAAWALLAYFAIWFGASCQMQTTTHLRGWDPNPILVLGNDTWTRPWQAWKGQVLLLEFWDRALPERTAVSLTGGGDSDVASTVPIAMYDLSSGSPAQDPMKFLPALAWRPAVAPQEHVDRLALEGQAWLVSEAPAPQLPARLENSNQFSIRIVCRPGETGESEGNILSIGRAASPADLVIGQEGAKLIFWFRTPLSAKHAMLSWTILNVFATSQSRDILYTYDGSSLSLFIDGKKEDRPYRLGPGAALARFIRRIRPGELEGYMDIYYSLVFFPAGILLGLAARKSEPSSTRDWLLLGGLLVAPPWILELLLAGVSGDAFVPGRAVVGLAFFAAGALWINAGPPPAASENSLKAGAVVEKS